jgi:hypothetical protein
LFGVSIVSLIIHVGSAMPHLFGSISLRIKRSSSMLTDPSALLVWYGVMRDA